jgi:hypothetical protein
MGPRAVSDCWSDFFIICDDVLVQGASRGGHRSALQVELNNPVEFARTRVVVMAKVRSERELVDHGIRVLVEALGYSGTARFLRHFSKGNTDYLEIQEKFFKGMRLDQIYKKASDHHSSKQS